MNGSAIFCVRAFGQNQHLSHAGKRFSHNRLFPIFPNALSLVTLIPLCKRDCARLRARGKWRGGGVSEAGGGGYRRRKLKGKGCESKGGKRTEVRRENELGRGQQGGKEKDLALSTLIWLFIDSCCHIIVQRLPGPYVAGRPSLAGAAQVDTQSPCPGKDSFHFFYVAFLNSFATS